MNKTLQGFRTRNLSGVLLILVLLVFLAPTRGDEEPVFFYNCTIGGHKYSTSPRWNWIKDTPDWKPGEPLPISIEAAIAAAKKELDSLAPKSEAFHFEYVDILSFRYVIPGKWCFLLEFGALSETSGAFLKARIPVNMSGVPAKLFRDDEPVKPVTPKP